DRIPKCVRRILVAKKSVAGLKRVQSRIVILDDLLDPPGGAGHRKRSILQTVHRTQATWLDARRDQRYVGASFDQMSERLVVGSAISKLRRVFSGRDGERGFVSRVAFAEDN